MPAFNDLTKKQFGRLTAVSWSKVKGRTRWKCFCTCGAEVSVDGAKLSNGNTKSCGCLRAELAGTQTLQHGHAGCNGNEQSPTYRSWVAMRSRCHNPNVISYPQYGAKGVKVCRRWDSFSNFLADMGERPEGTSLDRKKNHLGYSKSNCCWSTRTEQSRNRSNALLYSYKGRTQNLSAWCEELSLNYTTTYMRLKRGWSFEEAVS